MSDPENIPDALPAPIYIYGTDEAENIINSMREAGVELRLLFTRTNRPQEVNSTDVDEIVAVESSEEAAGGELAQNEVDNGNTSDEEDVVSSKRSDSSDDTVYTSLKRKQNSSPSDDNKKVRTDEPNLLPLNGNGTPQEATASQYGPASSSQSEERTSGGPLTQATIITVCMEARRDDSLKPDENDIDTSDSDEDGPVIVMNETEDEGIENPEHEDSTS